MTYLPDSGIMVSSTTLSTYANRTVTEGEYTVVFKVCYECTHLALKAATCSQEVSCYHNLLIVCAALLTHVVRVFCSVSDMGALTSLPTQADTTMIQGNSYTY